MLLMPSWHIKERYKIIVSKYEEALILLELSGQRILASLLELNAGDRQSLRLIAWRMPETVY
jgi:hypothetical protein